MTASKVNSTLGFNALGSALTILGAIFLHLGDRTAMHVVGWLLVLGGAIISGYTFCMVAAEAYD